MKFMRFSNNISYVDTLDKIHNAGVIASHFSGAIVMQLSREHPAHVTPEVGLFHVVLEAGCFFGCTVRVYRTSDDYLNRIPSKVIVVDESPIIRRGLIIAYNELVKLVREESNG